MSQDEQPIAQEVVTPPKSKWKFISLFFALLLLTLALVVGAGFFRFFGSNQQVSSELKQFSSQLESNQRDLAAVQSQLTQVQEQLRQQEGLAQQQAQAIQEWRNAARSQDYAKVLDAQYWVRLASDYLLLTSDVPQAQRLLTQAQDEMNKLSDPRVLPIQKALLQDMATLKSIPWVNATELYETLSTLQKQVDKMPLVLVPAPGQAVSPINNPEGSSSWWSRGVLGFKNALRQMVVVYHLPSAQVPPFITPDLGPYIYQNLHATLNSAMWAALHHNNEIYHASLQQAQEWTQQYFVSGSPQTHEVLTSLTALQAIAVHPAKEVTLISPTAFQEYMHPLAG